MESSRTRVCELPWVYRVGPSTGGHLLLTTAFGQVKIRKLSAALKRQFHFFELLVWDRWGCVLGWPRLERRLAEKQRERSTRTGIRRHSQSTERTNGRDV